jgi:hypothetical protein
VEPVKAIPYLPPATNSAQKSQKSGSSSKKKTPKTSQNPDTREALAQQDPNQPMPPVIRTCPTMEEDCTAHDAVVVTAVDSWLIPAKDCSDQQKARHQNEFKNIIQKDLWHDIKFVMTDKEENIVQWHHVPWQLVLPYRRFKEGPEEMVQKV